MGLDSFIRSQRRVSLGGGKEQYHRLPDYRLSGALPYYVYESLVLGIILLLA